MKFVQLSFILDNNFILFGRVVLLSYSFCNHDFVFSSLLQASEETLTQNLRTFRWPLSFKMLSLNRKLMVHHNQTIDRRIGNYYQSLFIDPQH